jgi:hypothetical protein
MNGRFRAHQIARLVDFCSSDPTITLSTRYIARAFGFKHSAVTRAALRGYEDPPGRGRHRALDPDSERDLIAWIIQKAANNMAVNNSELLHQWTTRFGVHITSGWVDSFIEWHSEELYQTKSIPHESLRLEVPRVFLMQRSTASGIMFTVPVQNWCSTLTRSASANGKTEFSGE